MGRSGFMALAANAGLHALAATSLPPQLHMASTSPTVYARGITFPQSAVVHPESNDILIVATPTDEAKHAISVGVLPRGGGAGSSVEAVEIIDDGSVVIAPVDIAIHEGTAFIVDQGNGSAIVAYNRSAEGKWKMWTQWKMDAIVPSCQDAGVRYGQPESIAITKTGVIYVSLAMEKMRRGLLCPLNRCCQSAATATTAFLRLNIDGNTAKLTEVFDANKFFVYNGSAMPFHARALDVIGDDDDLLISGYGDEGGYFGHSAWRWSFQARAGTRIAGSLIGPGGHQGDGGAATSALLSLPWGITSVGDALYIAESGNTDVRSVDAHGVISTLKRLPNVNQTDNFRKLHRAGNANSLLLTICGLGSNEGMVLRFDPDATQHYAILV